ncbi:MAG TPA: zf-HC2 domain-containing protein [Holophagaceae bacterium]|nr:zf-HC2 domain-containing protein [Holophagaceae bacterium]
MTALLLTCRDVTGLLTELDEGALGLGLRLRLRTHLAMCPPCRAFLASLKALPGLVSRLAAAEPDEPAGLEDLLQGALGRIQAREGRQPSFHPAEPLWAQAEQDPTLGLLLGAHLGRCDACRVARGNATPFQPVPGDALGAALRARLDPEARWTWHRLGLGGSRVAEVLRLGNRALHLLVLPEGVRFPDHRHAAPEIALVLEGRTLDGPDLVASGDLRTYGPGQAHAPVGAGPGDCLVLIRSEGPPRFTGWRRLLG